MTQHRPCASGSTRMISVSVWVRICDVQIKTDKQKRFISVLGEEELSYWTCCHHAPGPGGERGGRWDGRIKIAPVTRVLYLSVATMWIFWIKKRKRNKEKYRNTEECSCFLHTICVCLCHRPRSGIWCLTDLYDQKVTFFNKCSTDIVLGIHYFLLHDFIFLTHRNNIQFDMHRNVLIPNLVLWLMYIFPTLRKFLHLCDVTSTKLNHFCTNFTPHNSLWSFTDNKPVQFSKDEWAYSSDCYGHACQNSWTERQDSATLSVHIKAI